MTSPITYPLSSGSTYPLSSSLGTLMGAARSGAAAVVPTEAEFLAEETRDGIVPVYRIDLVRDLYWYNGVYYTSKAAYNAAGGPNPGSGFVSKAALGGDLSAVTIAFTGLLPATINASRETPWCLYSSSTNWAKMRLDSASGSGNAQFMITTANVAQMGGNGIQTLASGSYGSGTPWTSVCTVQAASSGSDKKLNIAAQGKIPVQNTTAVALSAFASGLALGYDPGVASAQFRGTFQTLTVWAANVGGSAARAISTGNKYGPSKVTLSGGGRDRVIDGYTYVARAGADGSPLLIKVRNDNGEMVAIKSIPMSGWTQDDHQTLNLSDTDDGGMVGMANQHDTSNVVRFTKCADRNPDNFPGVSSITLGGTLVPAYGLLRKCAIGASASKLVYFLRTNQLYWGALLSTDHGASWALLGGGTGRVIDDSVHSGDKLLISAVNEVSDGVFRCIANREPQYLDTEMRMFDVNIATNDVSANGVSIGAAGAAGSGNGALMANATRIWNPPAGFSAFGRDFKQWDQGLVGLLDETLNIQSFYWMRCNDTGAPWAEAKWDKTLICADEVTGRSGGGCVVGLAGLPYPTVAISRYHTADSLYHLEVWQATNAEGSAWQKIGDIATGDAVGDDTLVTPTSAPGAALLASVSWNFGPKASFTDFTQQAFWAATLGA